MFMEITGIVDYAIFLIYNIGDFFLGRMNFPFHINMNKLENL